MGVLISLLALLALVTILLLSLIPQLFDSVSTFMNNIESIQIAMMISQLS